MSKSNILYDKMIKVTIDYLGPAADRFIDRQIKNHLRKNPADITPKDLKTLIPWSRIAMALLTNDETMVDEFTDRLKALAQ